jgi:hypothetical protein
MKPKRSNGPTRGKTLTAAQSRTRQAHERAENITMRRKQCNLFQFWRVCKRRGCTRARACAGDPHVCFDHWWPQLPEVMKAEYRAMIEAAASGLPPNEAWAAAKAEGARWRETDGKQT